MELLSRVPAAIKALATRAVKAGGAPFLVGGAIIDLVLGREPKDWDLEVYRLGYNQLIEVYSDLSPKLVGAQFGILKLSAEKCGGFDVDINVPRTDNKIGVGHKGFKAILNPNLTPEEGCRRRDFSMNAMALNLLTGELIDPFGGLEDLKAGILRATDPALFVQDPLRGLRAMQLLARKAKVVDPSTMDLIRGMADSFPELSKERVFEEFCKLLLKAEKPSVGLEFLVASGWIAHFPELLALRGCGQHPDWHPEGDVWVHTCEVTDSAAWARDHVPEEWRKAFVFGAMLHDVGKPTTTVFPHLVEKGLFPKERLWTAWGHDKEGVAPATSFLRRMTDEKDIIEKAGVIVGEHMQPYGLYQGGAKDSAWKRLHGKIRLDVIGWMSRCDCCGRPSRSIWDPDLQHEISDHCFDRFGDLGPEPVEALLKGRDLIKAGLKPGKHFGARLERAYEAQIEDEDLNFEDLLAIALKKGEKTEGPQ